METQRIRAVNMREALALVQQAWGDGAVILQTRTLREEQADGTLADAVEVLVQVPADAPAETAPPLPEAVAPKAETAALAPDMPVEAPASEPGIDQYLSGLQEELRLVHSKLEGIASGMSWLGGGAAPQGELFHYLADEVVRRLPMSGGIRLGQSPHVVALIGPTGVGKSTMAAKLAWHFHLHAGTSVGLLTTDTFRIGGIETLRVTAGHLGIPFEVVYTPEEMPEALARLATCALVIIDTPGISPKDGAHLAEVRALLQQADPNEIHLVLNAGASPAALREVLLRYAVFQPDQVIVSKVDETSSLLDMLPVLFGAGLAISYLNADPSIPAKVTVASPQGISQHLTP